MQTFGGETSKDAELIVKKCDLVATELTEANDARQVCSIHSIILHKPFTTRIFFYIKLVN